MEKSILLLSLFIFYMPTFLCGTKQIVTIPHKSNIKHARQERRALKAWLDPRNPFQYLGPKLLSETMPKATPDIHSHKDISHKKIAAEKSAGYQLDNVKKNATIDAFLYAHRLEFIELVSGTEWAYFPIAGIIEIPKNVSPDEIVSVPLNRSNLLHELGHAKINTSRRLAKKVQAATSLWNRKVGLPPKATLFESIVEEALSDTNIPAKDTDAHKAQVKFYRQFLLNNTQGMNNGITHPSMYSRYMFSKYWVHRWKSLPRPTS